MYYVFFVEQVPFHGDLELLKSSYHKKSVVQFSSVLDPVQLVPPSPPNYMIGNKINPSYLFVPEVQQARQVHLDLLRAEPEPAGAQQLGVALVRALRVAPVPRVTRTRTPSLLI